MDFRNVAASLKRMANPDYAWLDESVETVVGTLMGFFKRIAG